MARQRTNNCVLLQVDAVRCWDASQDHFFLYILCSNSSMTDDNNLVGRQQLPSPSTVRRQYEDDQMQQEEKQHAHHQQQQPQQSLFHEYYHQQRSLHDDEDNHLSEAWDIPSVSEMKRRFDVRKDMLEETLEHRRTVPTEHHHLNVKCGRNICHVLLDRQNYSAARRNPYFHTATQFRHAAKSAPKENVSAGIPFPGSDTVTKELRTYMEHCSVTRFQAGYFNHLAGRSLEETEEFRRSGPHRVGAPLHSSKAISTISVAFSASGQTQASTHGDHTVKITHCSDGRLLKELVGHPRTPWTVKYHPTNDDIVASGCLGHQVRVWHWPTGHCLQMIRLEFAIISLSFHPSGQVLAVANGTRLHFWATPVFSDGEGAEDAGSHANTPLQQAPSSINNSDPNPPQQPPRGVLTEVEQRHMLRCVHFLPNGTSIIVGGVNPNTAQNRRQQPRGGISGGGMSFYLRLWDFDLHAALHPNEIANRVANKGLPRRAISNVSRPPSQSWELCLLYGAALTFLLHRPLCI
jgi:activator-of-BECN1-regulated-autophagy protein 1